MSVVIGDSIVATDGVNSWWNYITLLSGGKIVFRIQRGIPGNTSDSITKRLVDEALCWPGVKVAFCMQGTNDQGALTLAVQRQNDAAFIATCQGMGVTPVLVGLPPRSDDSARALTTLTANAQKQALCAATGAIYVDAFAPLGDPATGQYLSASYTSDNLHPSQAGHKLIAQRAILTLAAQLPLYGSFTSPITSDVINPVANSLIESGTSQASNWSWSGTTSGKTLSIVNDGLIRGRWQRVLWGSGSASGAAFLQQPITVTKLRGRRVAFTGRVRVAGLEANGGSIQALCTIDSGANAIPLYALNVTTIDFDGRFYVEGYVPAHTTAATIQFGFTAPASSPSTVTVDIGEIAVFPVPDLRPGLLHTRAQRVPRPCITVTSAYTATIDDDVILVDATAGPVTVTLPAAGTILYMNSGFSASNGVQTPSGGLGLTIIKTDSSANAVTVAAAGTDTINGAATQSIGSQYGVARPIVGAIAKWYLT